MMNFRTVKTAIQDLLDTQAAGRFRVIGKQVMSKSADEIKDNDRLVQVYYSDGSFPKSGRLHGPKTHDIVIEIDMTASAGAVGDLSILENPDATAIQKAGAIAAIREASDEADTKIDELIDAVYNILMDARYEGLLLDKGIISSRWIDRIQKDTLLERGEFVVKTANMKYTCRVQEIVSGDIGNQPARVIYDSTTLISADIEEVLDSVEKTGALIEVDNN
jgi:hypothetical protein